MTERLQNRKKVIRLDPEVFFFYGAKRGFNSSIWSQMQIFRGTNKTIEN